MPFLKSLAFIISAGLSRDPSIASSPKSRVKTVGLLVSH